jgi:hypothetical protein
MQYLNTFLVVDTVLINKSAAIERDNEPHSHPWMAMPRDPELVASGFPWISWTFDYSLPQKSLTD